MGLSLHPAAGISAEVGAGDVGPRTLTTETALEFGGCWLAPVEDDVDGTYDSVPLVLLRYSYRPDITRQVFIGAGYGQRHGDPYYDLPTFTDADAARLQVVPVQAGVRVNLRPPGDWRLWLGVLFEVTWLRETLPRETYTGGPSTATVSGWTPGFGLTVGPQWTPGGGRWGLGIEGAIVGNSGSIGNGAGLDEELTGPRGHLYVSRRL